MTPHFRAWLVAVVVAALPLVAAAENPTPDWTGLWMAERVFGPRVEGTLLLRDQHGALIADIAGFEIPVNVNASAYVFALPDGKGSFRGHRVGADIVGFWTQETTVTGGVRFATPVTLRKDGAGWRGEVTPAEDRFSYFLPVTRAADGRLAAYLRNPERNDGVFTQVQALSIEGDKAALIGNRRGRKEQVALFEGRVADGAFTMRMRGGTYDFARVSDEASSPFHPRGKPAARYRYARPLQRDDGWATATPEDAGMSREMLSAFVQKIIDTPMTAVGSSQIHSVLIARHGKLVLE